MCTPCVPSARLEVLTLQQRSVVMKEKMTISLMMHLLGTSKRCDHIMNIQPCAADDVRFLPRGQAVNGISS